jgi:hypothetical protein
MDVQTKKSQKRCSLCCQLAGQESASQKYGWPENDTSLPAAANDLTLVKDLKPGSSRISQLWQCPECGSYYLYETDYEYLVNGTEDEQSLTRLKIEQANRYLDQGLEGK